VIPVAVLVSQWVDQSKSNRTKVASVRPNQGSTSKRSSTPTMRRSLRSLQDNPITSNDESNDQPLGHFGTKTIRVHSAQSGNTYTLDADLDGNSLDRIYFPRGGWVDFAGCELEWDLSGECEDELGRIWIFEGSVDSYDELDIHEAIDDDSWRWR